MVNVLIGCTGSADTLKLPNIIRDLSSEYLKYRTGLEISVILTENAKLFLYYDTIPDNVQIFTDYNEIGPGSNDEDDELHIELGKWADLLLIAPLDANTLAKIAGGMYDNLLTSTARAWDTRKPLIFCPTFNTTMYDHHPVTTTHREILTSWGYIEIPTIEKTLTCGHTGSGAMAEVSTIVDTIAHMLNRSTCNGNANKII